MRSLRPLLGVWLRRGAQRGDHTVVLLLLILTYNKTTAAGIGDVYYDMFLNTRFETSLLPVPHKRGLPPLITMIIRGCMVSVQHRELLNPR